MSPAATAAAAPAECGWPRRIVVLGLSLSSSWGNGHATTWRALIRALAARGVEVLFLERDVPWYAANRDLADPDCCRLAFYDDLAGLGAWEREIADADAVILGSYVPEGVAVAEWLLALARGPVAFYDIDTPVTLGKLARGEDEYLTPDLVPQFDLYLSFSGGRALDLLTGRWGARMARPLYCGVDADAYRPEPHPKRWDLGYLGTWSADRQPALERLLIEPARRLPERRFVVAGPQYPASIDWPSNVERIEHVAPADHVAFYAASRLCLNTTRAEMVALGHSPSVRLFEAAACGAAIVTDRWDGITEFFAPGHDIVIADTSDDIVALVHGLDTSSGTAVGAAARSRVLREHTAARRVDALLGWLAEGARRRMPSTGH